MTPVEAFAFGSTVSFIITFVVLSSVVFRPRFIDLMTERDRWRHRAIHAEDSPTLGDIDVSILGTWDQPLPPDWDKPTPGRSDSTETAGSGLGDDEKNRLERRP